jgi:CRISPR-associated protein Cmr2
MSQSLLKVQIGPVQEFIAQARSTRDLWSGSYLLSWLVASGLNCLMQKGAEAGLDETTLKACVVFPRLESQPLLQKLQPNLFPPPGGNYNNDELLTPNLTNLFLAELELESGKAADMARDIEQAIRNEWKNIAKKCWEFSAALTEDADKARFDRQVASLLHIAWQVTPLVEGAAAEQMLKSLPLSKALQEKISIAAGTDLSFPATLALNSWQLDAVRQVRDFPGWRDANGHPGKHNEKDSLTGREEQIAGGRDWWDKCVKDKQVEVRARDGSRRPVKWEILFRERQASEHFGAITFIKRVWHLAYLEPEHGLEAGHRRESRGKQFPFPSTLHIASHDPAKNEDDLLDQLPEEAADSQKYFAVLTMDGDEMGKWMSGDKFDGPADEPKLREFSHCLSTFGLKCARPIVEACDGRLIYSGGDDVVALLPADTALQCAGFLRAAFKGQVSFIAPLTALAGRLLNIHHNNAHLQLAADNKLFAKGSQEGELILHPQGQAETLSLPGTIADVSAGLAIAHFKSPLQDVVRAAQAAERRAKGQLGRSAVAITLMKRSGEITEWGCKWESGGLEIYDAVMEAMTDRAVSSRFPHRIIELLDAYLTETSPLAANSLEPLKDFPVVDIALRDFCHVLDRQSQNTKSPAYSKLVEITREDSAGRAMLADYLKRTKKEAEAKLTNARKDAESWSRLAPEQKRRLEHGPVESPIQALIGLCQTVAFAHRTAETDSPSESSASSVVSTPPAERQTA